MKFNYCSMQLNKPPALVTQKNGIARKRWWQILRFVGKNLSSGNTMQYSSSAYLRICWKSCHNCKFIKCSRWTSISSPIIICRQRHSTEPPLPKCVQYVLYNHDCFYPPAPQWFRIMSVQPVQKCIKHLRSFF